MDSPTHEYVSCTSGRGSESNARNLRTKMKHFKTYLKKGSTVLYSLLPSLDVTIH